MSRAAKDIHVGIDFGGTKVFGALVDKDDAGEPLVSDETYVQHVGSGEIPADFTAEERALGAGYARLHDLARGLIELARSRGRNPAGVGIGAPGLVGPGGVVLAAGSLGWKNAALGPLLERRLEVPVRIENDVNLAALGEHAFGAGRGKSSLFLIAIGTGIGGASIIDGKLWRGGHYAAGEIGALLPGPEYLTWADRDWGAFEAHASGTGLEAQARKAALAHGVTVEPGTLRGERLFAAAAAGEPWAKEVIDRAVELWTVALGAIQVLVDPDVIVFSGGVAGSAAQFLPAIEAKLHRSLLQAPIVVRSTLGYRAGVLGAPTLFG